MECLLSKLIHYTNKKEDFFTECFAAALKRDPVLTKEILHKITGIVWDAETKIETQKQFKESRLDMVLTIGTELGIGVENKLYAEEGENQLVKYLKLTPKSIDKICFITAYRNTHLARAVIERPNYLKPDHKNHFLWDDFYDIIEKNAEREQGNELTKELMGLFKSYGFDPPHPQIGDMGSKTNRENFAKLWKPTMEMLSEQGWKSISPGSIAELYVKNGTSKTLEMVWLDPWLISGSLRVRLTPKTGTQPETIKKQLESQFGVTQPEIEVVETKRKSGKEKALDIIYPLKEIVPEDCKDTETISRKLEEFVMKVLNAAETQD